MQIHFFFLCFFPRGTNAVTSNSLLEMSPFYLQFRPVFPPSTVVFAVFSDCLEWKLLLKSMHFFALLSCVKLLQLDIVFLNYGDTSRGNLNPHSRGKWVAETSKHPLNSVLTRRRVGLMFSARDRMGNDQLLVSFKIMILHIPKAFFPIWLNSFALMFTYCRYKCVITKFIILPIVRKYFQLLSILKNLNK